MFVKEARQALYDATLGGHLHYVLEIMRKPKGIVGHPTLMKPMLPPPCRLPQ